MGDFEVSGPYLPDQSFEDSLRENQPAWAGWIDHGMYGPWTTPEGYGTGGAGIAYILTPAGFTMTDNVIDTSSLLSAFAAHTPDLGGWTGIDPDGDPETVELGGLSMDGYRGEGMRGANALRDAEGNMVGEQQTAVKFDVMPTEQAIATSTMGLGFVEMTTSDESGYHVEKLFFNYSTISSEPTYAITKENVSLSDEYRRTFYKENPFYYSEDESAGLQYKFGWNPIYASTEGLGSQLTNIVEASVRNLVKQLNSTYPVSYATFPRTPPLNLSSALISAVPGTEEEGQRPTGTTALRQQAQMQGGPAPGSAASPDSVSAPVMGARGPIY